MFSVDTVRSDPNRIVVVIRQALSGEAGVRMSTRLVVSIYTDLNLSAAGSSSTLDLM